MSKTYRFTDDKGKVHSGGRKREFPLRRPPKRRAKDALRNEIEEALSERQKVSAK